MGYVQQDDIHLPTATVREALEFSALSRQPHHVPTKEKLEYVDKVMRMLEMESFADAIVGVPGGGRSMAHDFFCAVEVLTLSRSEY